MSYSVLAPPSVKNYHLLKDLLRTVSSSHFQRVQTEVLFHHGLHNIKCCKTAHACLKALRLWLIGCWFQLRTDNLESCHCHHVTLQQEFPLSSSWLLHASHNTPLMREFIWVKVPNNLLSELSPGCIIPSWERGQMKQSNWV